MMQTQQLTTTQQGAFNALCHTIRLIEQFVPLEQESLSDVRREALASAHTLLRRSAEAFGISIPAFSGPYQPARYLEHAHLVAQALVERFAPSWRLCEKMTLTRARKLTQADFEIFQGRIETREGPAPFTVGDYLAVDARGEYPIPCATIEQRSIQVAPPDAQGWASYRSTEQREARQQFRAFTTDRGVTGQAGDYLMRGVDGQTWPCARAKFEREYRWCRQPQHFVTVDLLILHPASQSVLFIQRKKPPFAGLWALPGGHVEIDRQESLEEAARRELREETGLDCSNWTLHQVGAFGDPGRDPRGAYVSILFVALADTPAQPIVCAGDDADTVAWFPLTELPDLAFDHGQMVCAACSYLASCMPKPGEQPVADDCEVTA